jgi:curved DNA-binding protein CbpA
MTDGTSGGDPTLDYYEVLQISPNAEPETIHRVFRLLAQQVHPDNKETGDEERFRLLHRAYLTLSDPEQRARYDISYHEARNTRWRPVSTPIRGGDDLELEHVVRLTVLEVLYATRRADLNAPGLFILDLEEITGRAREHLEFTLWYLNQKQFIQREDNSRVSITAAGIDYLEQHYQEGVKQRRLRASNSET